MEVALRAELIKGKAIGMPRVESPTQLMTRGQAGSLDDTLRLATAGTTQWLQQAHGGPVRFNVHSGQQHTNRQHETLVSTDIFTCGTPKPWRSLH